MLYWLVTAMYPQFLITLDEDLQDKQVTVRVGQAVNTVGLAGQRLGISGVSASAPPSSPLPVSYCSYRFSSSKLIKRQFASAPASEQNSAQTSSSRMRACWRIWSSSRRTILTRQRMRSDGCWCLDQKNRGLAIRSEINLTVYSSSRLVLNWHLLRKLTCLAAAALRVAKNWTEPGSA